MRKNTAGKLLVYAYGAAAHASPGDPITSDAGNITADVYVDGAAADALTDANPVELASGYYLFDTTQAETNGDHLAFVAVSGTSDVLVRCIPEADYTSGTINVVSGIVESNLKQVGDEAISIGGDAPSSPYGQT